MTKSATQDPNAPTNEDTGRKANEDTRTVRQFETDDGTPVEPSTLPPKNTFGEMADELPPHIHEVPVKNDANDKSKKDDSKK